MPLPRKETDAANEDTPKEPKAPPCVACRNPSECEIWGTAVCYPCAADWNVNAPTYGDIETEHGKDADAPAVYREFTKMWIEQRRRLRVA